LCQFTWTVQTVREVPAARGCAQIAISRTFAICAHPRRAQVSVSALRLNEDMTSDDKVVGATLDISAPADRIFELIADPAQQPRWDGNDNLAEAQPGQRVTRVGDVFTMTLTNGNVRENHIVEFDEGRLIAWLPSEPGSTPPGHLWRWALESLDATHTRVTHTYDWTRLTDEKRLARARSTTTDSLRGSLDRLAAVAEHG
jgi:uncharacterized protein YndB with AHSA1/START domain